MNDEINVSLVPQGEVPLVWDQVKDFLEGATDRTDGRVDIYDVQDELEMGSYQLWIAFTGTGEIVGAVTTRIIEYPQRRMLHGDMAGGKGLKDWQTKMLELLDQFAKDQKCSAFEMYGRRGWEKVLKPYGWDARQTVYLKEYE